MTNWLGIAFGPLPLCPNEVEKMTVDADVPVLSYSNLRRDGQNPFCLLQRIEMTCRSFQGWAFTLWFHCKILEMGRQVNVWSYDVMCLGLGAQ